jgi:hypothetical protein
MMAFCLHLAVFIISSTVFIKDGHARATLGAQLNEMPTAPDLTAYADFPIAEVPAACAVSARGATSTVR